LYIFAPNFPVRWRDALVGAATAGVVLELLKAGFGFYVTHFPTYQTIYGALATFPIFLLWMYLAWIVVLYGAEMAAARPEWRAGVSRETALERSPAAVLAAAAAILALLLAVSHRGGGLRRRLLIRRASQPTDLIDRAADLLLRKRYISRTDSGELVLSRDLDTVTLSELHRDLGLSVSPIAAGVSREPWGAELSQALLAAEEAERKLMETPLKRLLQMPEDSRTRLSRAGEDDAEDEDAGEDGEHQDGDYKPKLLAWLGLAWLATR